MEACAVRHKPTLFVSVTLLHGKLCLHPIGLATLHDRVKYTRLARVRRKAWREKALHNIRLHLGQRVVYKTDARGLLGEVQALPFLSRKAVVEFLL